MQLCFRHGTESLLGKGHRNYGTVQTPSRGEPHFEIPHPITCSRTGIVLYIIRRFDVEVMNQGRYVVAGGVAYNKDFEVTLSARR